jgi:hypothetical protein
MTSIRQEKGMSPHRWSRNADIGDPPHLILVDCRGPQETTAADPARIAEPNRGKARGLYDLGIALLMISSAVASMISLLGVG